MSRCAFALIFAIALVFAAISVVNAQTDTSIYGTMEAFMNLRSSPNFALVPNTPVPTDCPEWAKIEGGIDGYAFTYGDALSPATVKTMWIADNLSPQIGANFNINAFINAITGVAPIADEMLNQTVAFEYMMMKDIVTYTYIWNTYGPGKNPQCVAVFSGVIPTVPPRPTDVTDAETTTYYQGTTFPPFPTEPAFTGEPGAPSKPMYEPGSLIMMVDVSFPKTGTGSYDYATFLTRLQAYVNFPTSTLQLNNDLWDPTQIIINNVTASQADILVALTSATLANLGVVYIHRTSNDIPWNDIILESDYNRLINITATFERAKPLPSSCPLYLTNDTLLSQLASKQYPLQTAIILFSDTYGKNFDGWNTSCLMQFWTISQGETPSCPADFGNVFPTLPPGSDMPSGDMPSGDMPSGDSNEPSGTGTGSAGPIPTTPSQALHCRIPFQDYAPCVLAQNTLGIVMYLRDAKNQYPECFCKGAECVTPPPSTLYPEVSANSNGSFDTSLPFPTGANESYPPFPDNFSVPSGLENVSSDPYENIIDSMISDIISLMNHSHVPNSDIPSEDSTLAPGQTTGKPQPPTTLAPGQTTSKPTTLAPGQTTSAPTTLAPGQTTSKPTTLAPGQTTGAPQPTTTLAPGQTTSAPEPTTEAPPGETTTEAPPTTTTPAPPTTTDPKQLPNSVDFVKTSTFNDTTFGDQLAKALGINPADVKVTQDPKNSSIVIVTFTNSDPNTNYDYTQKATSLSPSELQAIGTSSAATNSNNAANNDSTTEAPAKKNNTPIIAGAIVAAAAVLALVAFFIWNRSRNASRSADGGDVALDRYVNHQDFSDFNRGVSDKELGSLNSEHGMHAV